MSFVWPSNTNDESSWKWYETKTVVVAYIDDTIYMDNNKQSLQIAVDTASKFFSINDIKINAKKSDFIIIHLFVAPDDQYIKIQDDGNDFAYIKPTKEEVRYLRVFFSCKPLKT